MKPAHQKESFGSLLKILHKFTRLEHTLFSLPLLLAGAWLGSDRNFPSWRILGLIFLAGVGARVFGMALNRIIDRDLDALNQRTVGRALPSGQMSIFSAVLVATAGLSCYMTACFGLGGLCLYLSPLPLIVLTFYSYLKRFTSYCHFGIGLCLALAPLGAYVAASSGIVFSSEIILLAIFTFFWISAFDIIYALQDIDADLNVGVHSLPAALGSAKAQIVAALLHLIAIFSIAFLWHLIGGGVLSTAALLVAIAAFGLAYWQAIPLNIRFFPISAVAGISGALVPLLGGLG